jgi:hypothetical protein
VWSGTPNGIIENPFYYNMFRLGCDIKDARVGQVIPAGPEYYDGE